MNENVVIRLEGRFDFSCFKAFQAQYEPLLSNAQVRIIDVNFGMVNYLDSSALGMLMLLREKAEKAGKKVRIAQCSGMPRDILDMANFQKCFEFI